MVGGTQTKASAGGDKANRRKTRIINPRFQWKYASIIGMVVFLFTCTISFVLYGLLHHQARMRMIDPGHYLTDVAPVIVFFGVMFAAVTACGVGVWSAFASQRICGPLFVLERYLHELAQGKFPSPRPLRRKDEFKELYAAFADAVNAMKESKRGELAALTRSVNVARAALNADEQSRIHALSAVADEMEKLRQLAAKSLGENDGPLVPVPSIRSASDEHSPVSVG